MTAPPKTIPTPFDLAEGNCAGERLRPRLKQDLWFPPDSGTVPNVNAQAARDEAWRLFCRSCPVLEACFEHALEYELFGTWAGTTEQDRWRLRQEFASDDDPELLEYARNRLHAGYVPIPSITCVRKGCTHPVTKDGTMCRRHKAMAKRAETRKEKK